MRSRRVGIWRQDWYSICSVHREHKKSCRMCRAGRWHYRAAMKLDSLFYWAWPWAWRKWANRKNSRTRKWLESIFPGLRND